MFDLSVSCVPRPCLYMLGSSTPVVFECKNLSHPIITWCFGTTYLRNGAQLRGRLSWNFSEGSSYLCYRRSKQIRCKHDKHHMQIIKWRDMANIILRLWSPSMRRDMITFVTGMTPWSPSSWSPSLCLHEVVTPTITSTSMANAFSNKVK